MDSAVFVLFDNDLFQEDIFVNAEVASDSKSAEHERWVSVVDVSLSVSPIQVGGR